MNRPDVFRRPRRSFGAALRGIGVCLCSERHMRFHTAAAAAALAVSPFFDWSALHYAVLLLTIALVMAAEMVNSAVERLTDGQTSAFSPRAGTIKDIAAGAGLVCAIFAVGVGVCLYAQPEGLARLIRFLTHPGWGSTAAVAFAAVLILFVVPGPAALLRAVRRKHRRPSERKN